MAFLGGVFRCVVDESLNEDTIAVQYIPDDPNLYKSQILNIEFKRTIRVPDNIEKERLPPGLGTFPLLKVHDFASKLPPNMAAKGGVFFPMYQREAMWIDFTANSPFMIKIYAGGINVVSGEHSVETLETKMRRLDLVSQDKSIQDYVVAPPQPWLDGFAVSPGVVRQFVAMPLGEGYTVEAQLTGRETVGGLQFEITPCLPTKQPHREPVGGIALMGMAAGGKIDQAIRKDTNDPNIWATSSTITIPVHILTSAAFRGVTGREPPPCPISASTYADAGLPFFYLPEKPTTISGDFDAVKSVNEIDQDRGLAQGSESSINPTVVQLNERGSIAGPTNHVDLSTLEDPDHLINPDGPLREFRTLNDMLKELEGLSLRDEEGCESSHQ